MNLHDPERADALAGEYVLGTLRGRARQRLERLARTDRIVADAVRGWEERLWAAILARIRSAATTPRARSLLWAPAGWWRGLALVGLATSLALAIALLKPAPEAPEGTLVVVLAGGDAKPVLVATAARTSRYLVVKAIAPVAVAPDRSLQLWMLPETGNPRSLGLVSTIAPSGVARIELPVAADRALQNIPALAISLEPAGGSPTGLPTGPVLYTGPVQRLY